MEKLAIARYKTGRIKQRREEQLIYRTRKKTAWNCSEGLWNQCVRLAWWMFLFFCSIRESAPITYTFAYSIARSSNISVLFAENGTELLREPVKSLCPTSMMDISLLLLDLRIRCRQIQHFIQHFIQLSSLLIYRGEFGVQSWTVY